MSDLQSVIDEFSKELKDLPSPFSYDFSKISIQKSTLEWVINRLNAKIKDWIHINESFPDPEKPVLVLFKGFLEEMPITGYITKEGKWLDCDQKEEMATPEYWCHIPEFKNQITIIKADENN